jgi:mRNA interferase RelE/StbE
LLARIADLAGNPRPPGCQKLSAQERYRLRVGRYRVVYEIRDRELVVLVVKVADRKDVYRH